MDIEAQITVTATYDDAINITVQDKTSTVRFLEMTMTREQFINATMNRLACTGVLKASVNGFDRVGKTMEMDDFVVEIPKWHDSEGAVRIVRKECPDGWVPDLYFGSQGSFFDKDGRHYARTTIRRWV